MSSFPLPSRFRVSQRWVVLIKPPPSCFCPAARISGNIPAAGPSEKYTRHFPFPARQTKEHFPLSSPGKCYCWKFCPFGLLCWFYARSTHITINWLILPKASKPFHFFHLHIPHSLVVDKYKVFDNQSFLLFLISETQQLTIFCSWSTNKN